MLTAPEQQSLWHRVAEVTMRHACRLAALDAASKAAAGRKISVLLTCYCPQLDKIVQLQVTESNYRSAGTTRTGKHLGYQAAKSAQQTGQNRTKLGNRPTAGSQQEVHEQQYADLAPSVVDGPLMKSFLVWYYFLPPGLPHSAICQQHTLTHTCMHFCTAQRLRFYCAVTWQHRGRQCRIHTGGGAQNQPKGS